MYRTFLAVCVLGLLAGCESSSSKAPLSKAPGSEDQARLAAMSAQLDFPSDATASNDMQTTAVVNQKDKTVTIRNFTDRNLNNVNVWINGNYVRQVDSIPANGAITVNYAQFYNRMGQSLAQQNINIQRVHLQSGDTLYNVQGPQLQ